MDQQVYTKKRNGLTHTELKKFLSTIKNRKHAFKEHWVEIEDVSVDKSTKGKGEWGQTVFYHQEQLRYNVTLFYTV